MAMKRDDGGMCVSVRESCARRRREDMFLGDLPAAILRNAVAFRHCVAHAVMAAS